MSLNADQTPSSSSLPTASQPQVFQAGSSKPLHSSGINVNAAPFQSMQTVSGKPALHPWVCHSSLGVESVIVFGYSRFSGFAASLQSCKTEFLLLQVFNMNAPVPPVNEPETLKQQNQYQASYNQSFSNQPHQVEQSDLQQEQLQTGKILEVLVEQVISL